MLDILTKVAYLMALTIVIGFFIAFIIKLIVLIINASGDLHKYDRKYLKDVRRARNIKKIRIRRLYRDTMNSNEILSNRYGMNIEGHFKLKKTNNSNELIDHYYGK
ncbi:MAG: hypothetical protein HXX18_10750 [Bacteroidetes bacterium]|nr:hypothetical protein [Bacteroidota bacterium]